MCIGVHVSIWLRIYSVSVILISLHLSFLSNNKGVLCVQISVERSNNCGVSVTSLG